MLLRVKLNHSAGCDISGKQLQGGVTRIAHSPYPTDSHPAQMVLVTLRVHHRLLQILVLAAEA